jgi:hypothetical protein
MKNSDWRELSTVLGIRNRKTSRKQKPGGFAAGFSRRPYALVPIIMPVMVAVVITATMMAIMVMTPMAAAAVDAAARQTADHSTGNGATGASAGNRIADNTATHGADGGTRCATTLTPRICGSHRSAERQSRNRDDLCESRKHRKTPEFAG